MRGQAESSSRQEGRERGRAGDSESEEPSEELSHDEVLADDSRIEELHRSVERLRELVGAAGEDAWGEVPGCVREYCDKLEQYLVRSGAEVLEIAERRVNKMLRNRRVKRNWNSEDIKLLVWLVSHRLRTRALLHFNELTREDWQAISQMISGSTWQKCKFRWLGLKKVKLVTHKWSKAESRLLAESIGESSKINWKAVSQRLYERNHTRGKVFRTAKQCRQHWNCFLNPNIQKGPWSLMEDRRLLEYVLELEGSKKWSEIAKFMEGRTENALKNRFNLLVGRQRKASGHLTEKRLVRICLNRLMLEEGQQQERADTRPLPPPLPAVEIRESPSANRTPPLPVEPASGEASQPRPESTSYHRLFNIFTANLSQLPAGMQGAPNGMFIGFVFPTPFF